MRLSFQLCAGGLPAAYCRLMDTRLYYVRDRDNKWCIATAPNRRSLCGQQATGHAWPHTARVLPEDAALCPECAAHLEEL